MLGSYASSEGDEGTVSSLLHADPVQPFLGQGACLVEAKHAHFAADRDARRFSAIDTLQREKLIPKGKVGDALYEEKRSEAKKEENLLAKPHRCLDLAHHERQRQQRVQHLTHRKHPIAKLHHKVALSSRLRHEPHGETGEQESIEDQQCDHHYHFLW